MSFGTVPKKQASAAEIAAVNVEVRELKKEYMDYWNGTASKTSTGRAVDAIICPLAPFAAARPEKYLYYGYSTWVNLLDYTSLAFPVTKVDKAIDGIDQGYKPLDETDKLVHESCKFCYDQVPLQNCDEANCEGQTIQRFMTGRMLACSLWEEGFRRRRFSRLLRLRPRR
jgi:hypothetical protein